MAIHPTGGPAGGGVDDRGAVLRDAAVPCPEEQGGRNSV